MAAQEDLLQDQRSRPVRLQPEPSFVLPNRQVALRQNMTSEGLREICKTFDKDAFDRRCYREATVMPMLVAQLGFDPEKMGIHIQHGRNVAQKPPDKLWEILNEVTVGLACKTGKRKPSGVSAKITDLQRADVVCNAPCETNVQMLLEQVDCTTNNWLREGVRDAGGDGLSPMPAPKQESMRDVIAISPNALPNPDMAAQGSSCPPVGATPLAHGCSAQKCSPPGSAPKLDAGVDFWLPQQMHPDDLRDELEIAVAMGRLKPMPKGHSARGGPSSCHRFPEVCEMVGRPGPQPFRRLPLHGRPQSKGARGEQREMQILPEEGSHWMKMKQRPVKQHQSEKSSIGVRLYRLGLNPLKRPPGSKPKTKNEVRRYRPNEATFAN